MRVSVLHPFVRVLVPQCVRVLAFHPFVSQMFRACQFASTSVLHRSEGYQLPGVLSAHYRRNFISAPVLHGLFRVLAFRQFISAPAASTPTLRNFVVSSVLQRLPTLSQGIPVLALVLLMRAQALGQFSRVPACLQDARRAPAFSSEFRRFVSA